MKSLNARLVIPYNHYTSVVNDDHIPKLGKAQVDTTFTALRHARLLVALSVTETEGTTG